MELIHSQGQSHDIYDTTHLKKREIRLLQLLPVRETETGLSFGARLFTASLDSLPWYDALSYRWEGLNQSQKISVNGYSMSISNNLYLALNEIRNVSVARGRTSAFNLWVDGICINQSSIDERNNQVRLMGEIYSRAVKVRIWIGDSGSTDVAAAFRLLEDCPSLRIGRFFQAKDIEDYVQRFISDFQGAKSLTDLLHRPYWNRMWVFQEIVLAGKAEVYCGSTTVDWEFFQLFDKIMGNRQFWIDAQNSHPWIFDLRKAEFRIAHLMVSREDATSIHNVLQPTRHLECQDQRDKLYALLGVCPSLVHDLRPDYSIAPREVYTTFSRNQILKDGNLSILGTAGLSQNEHRDDIGLPSWVLGLRTADGVDIRYLAGMFSQRFDAAGPAEAAIDFLDDGDYRILKTPASFTDVIDIRGNLLDCGDEDKTALDRFCTMENAFMPSVAQVRQFFCAIIFQDATFYGQADDSQIQKEIKTGLYDDILAGVCGDLRKSNMGTATQYVRECQKERLKRLVLGFTQECSRYFGSRTGFIADLLDSFQDTGLQLQRGPQHEPLEPYSAEELDLSRRDFSARAEKVRGKEISAICRTLKGSIGIGPKSTQPGDQIALVMGCRVPLVLRQHGDFYRLVGPCYVAGMMQGEAVRDGESFFKPFQIV